MFVLILYEKLLCYYIINLGHITNDVDSDGDGCKLLMRGKKKKKTINERHEENKKNMSKYAWYEFSIHF